MKLRALPIWSAVIGLLLALPILTIATAAPAFGPGTWAVNSADAAGARLQVDSWRVVADCGNGCLTVNGGGASAQFTQQTDGTWTGSWRVVDGKCYDDANNVLPSTATWTADMVINPDLSVVDHVQDERGCGGGTESYDSNYTLTLITPSESESPGASADLTILTIGGNSESVSGTPSCSSHAGGYAIAVGDEPYDIFVRLIPWATPLRVGELSFGSGFTGTELTYDGSADGSDVSSREIGNGDSRHTQYTIHGDAVATSTSATQRREPFELQVTC